MEEPLLNFNQQIERTNTASQKWDNLLEVFQSTEVLPLWVADMDFAVPPAVKEALSQRVEHGVFGYSTFTPAYYDAIIQWMQTRHQWAVEKEWIQFVPGVVPALNFIVQTFTEPGDQIVIQTPVYPPFYKVVLNHKRKLVRNPLVRDEDGTYRMDYEDLERKFAEGKIRMMILCSPHNPVGRVWTKTELTRLAELCEKWKVMLVSDEIHADMIFEQGAHTPFTTLSDYAQQHCIVCTSPSKTFNMAGFQTANMIIPNPELKSRILKTLQLYSLQEITPLGLVATQAAYSEGGPWLDALLDHVRDNMSYVREFCKHHLPEIQVNDPEGTYLLWMDFRQLGMPDDELFQFLVQEARLGLNAGVSFGKEGQGFMRMNMACTRQTLEEAMHRLQTAVLNWRASRR